MDPALLTLLVVVALVAAVVVYMVLDARRTLAKAAAGGGADAAREAPFALTGWGGVFSAVDGGIALLVFPAGTAGAYDELGDAPPDGVPEGAVQTMLVFNHTDEGCLAGSRLARRLGVETVLATDPARPIDRGVDEDDPLAPAPAEPPLDWGALRLTAVEGQAHLYRAAWAEGGASELLGLVGLDVPLTLKEPPVGAFLGTVAVDSLPDGERPELLASSLERGAVVVLFETGRGQARRIAAAFAEMGLNATVVGRSADDLAADAVEVVIRAIARGDLEAAEAALAAAAEAHPDHGAVAFQRGILRLLDDDAAAAEAEFRAAAEAERPLVVAWSSLVDARVRLGDHAGAVAAAAKALEALPEDPITVRNAVKAYAVAGERAKALEVLEASELEGPDLEQWAATLRDPEAAFDLGPATFPLHAELALELAGEAVEGEGPAEGERLLRWALRLDPDLDPDAVEGLEERIAAARA